MLHYTFLILVLHLCVKLNATPTWSVFSYAPEKINRGRTVIRRPDVLLAGRSGLTTTSTSQYDGKPEKCRQQGWYYCFSDQQCYLSKDDAKDCFFKCVNIVGEIMCSAYGCVYDYEKNKCGGTFRAGRFALNICGEATYDSDGNWYRKDDKRLPTDRCYSRQSKYPEFPKSMNPVDYPLYEKQLEDLSLITQHIPVYEDGKYTLRILICDVAYGGYHKRVLDGAISNGIQTLVIFSNLKVNNGTNKPQDIVDQFVELTVKDNARTLVYMGQEISISDYRFMLKVSKNKASTLFHTILNGVLLLKH